VTTLDCRTLLFDLDGVLVDSTECVERTWRDWAALRGLEAGDVLRVAHGRRAVETVRLLAPALDAEEELAALVAREATETAGVYDVEGARELLHALPPGSWAVVTSGVRAVAELRLRHTRLPIPAVMVCADEVTRGKPDPEGYLTAAARLGAPPGECIVVEDAPAGLGAAGAAGMRSIALTTTHSASELTAATVVADRLTALRVEVRGGHGLRVTVPAR